MSTLPWDFIGTDISNLSHANEILKQANLDWGVRSQPIYRLNYNLTPPKEEVIQGWKSNVRMDNDTTLGVVTDRYKLVQNADAFTFADELVGEGLEFVKAGVTGGGKKTWITAKLPDHNILGDATTPYIVFTNSHDGKGGMKIFMSPVRLTCMNMMNLLLKHKPRTYTITHSGDIRFKLADAMETLKVANDYMSGLNKEAEKLAQKVVSDSQLKEFSNTIFPLPEEKEKQTPMLEMQQRLQQALQAENLQRFKGTAWGVINAITDITTHTQPRKISTRSREVMFEKLTTGHELTDKAYKLLDAI